MKREVWLGFALIVGVFLIQSIPAFEQKVLIPATISHPHLVVLAEAVVGVIAVWIAGRRKTVTVQ